MYGNPYTNPQFNIDDINSQIQRLERIRNGFMNQPQPIQNIINTNTPTIDFEARMLNENEKVEDLFVQRKTAFIDLKNGFLKIKETNGNIAEYEIVLPRDEKDILIEELEKRLNEYERNTTNNEIEQSPRNVIEPNDTTTKGNSKSIFKKSQ